MAKHRKLYYISLNSLFETFAVRAKAIIIKNINKNYMRNKDIKMGYFHEKIRGEL